MNTHLDEADRLGAAYLEHLTDADLRLLADAEAVPEHAVGRRVDALRREPALVLDVLDRPAITTRVLSGSAERGDGRFTMVTPFLVFVAAVHRAALELAGTSHVPDRAAPRLRVPVFDGAQLSEYLAHRHRRLFLAELLASFARVSSGVAVVQTPHGPRRRRWNDIDPRRLAVLLEAVPETERASVWWRLGDLALFLTGVFPDAVERGLFSRVDLAALARVTGVHAEPGTAAGTDLLEWFGSRWYLQAARRVSAATAVAVLREHAEHFHLARRVLNVVADRYLFPLDDGWFVDPRRA